MAKIKIAKTYPVTQHPNVTVINYDQGYLFLYKPLLADCDSMMVVKDKYAVPPRKKLVGKVNSNAFARLIDVIYKAFPGSSKTNIYEASAWVYLSKRNVIYTTDALAGEWKIPFPKEMFFPHSAIKLIHKIMEEYSPEKEVKFYVNEDLVSIVFRKEIVLSYTLPHNRGNIMLKRYRDTFNYKLKEKINISKVITMLGEPVGKKLKLETMKGYDKNEWIRINNKEISIYYHNNNYDMCRGECIKYKTKGKFDFFIKCDHILSALKYTEDKKRLNTLLYDKAKFMIKIGNFFMMNQIRSHIDSGTIKK
jgi:hypothetical protein